MHIVRKNFFFIKQKTAYEMRISDWSSDVCSSDLHAQEGCRGKLGRPAIDAGEHQLRGAVHFDIEEASSAFIAQFRDIDVEVANLIFLELLRLLPIGFGQPTDPVALQATVQRRACQVWDHVLQRDEHVVERQSRLHRTDRKSTRLNSSHYCASRMPSSA